MTFFCENAETVLQAIAPIELARKGWIESVLTQSRVWSVLVHQIFALTLQFGAISSENCWKQLSIVPDFSGIDRSEFERSIAHMIKENFLFTSEGFLSLGEKAEKTFGRRNFMELYAVFNRLSKFQLALPHDYSLEAIANYLLDIPKTIKFLQQMTCN
jgi:ATP-dependent helicase Lhr and Lhr-like helicase